MSLDRLFLALHLFGGFIWIGGLFQLASFLTAVQAEGDSGARARLAQRARKLAVLPDVGATLALVFGLHWLFRFKLYAVPYMHIKLGLIVFVLILHVFLRLRSKRAAQGQAVDVPAFVRPVLGLLALGIITLVITKWPL
jgi:uncharacterized membrane protein